MANNQSVRLHLDAFTRGRIIGKLEEGRSVTSVAEEFGIAHSIVSRLWRQFQLQEQLSGDQPEETGGRQREKSLDTRHRRLTTDISRFTVARRSHGGGLFARRPVRYLNACPSEKAFSVVPGTPELRDNEWGRVLFYR
ncbi:hypothetical protein TNCV_1701131 [Trichonephila clavipes]|nr:hypothetical protein TNCV_1701131 [Trichonephila clavipes]